MKVLHIVSRAIFPLKDGHSIRNHNIFKELVKFDVTIDVVSNVITLHENNIDKGKPVIKNGVTYHYMLTQKFYNRFKKIYENPLSNKIFQTFLIFYNYFNIKNKIKISEFDIIQGHSNYRTGLCAYFLAKKYKKPFIYDLHALTCDNIKKTRIKYYISKKAEGFLIKKADAILTIDENLKKHILNLFAVRTNIIQSASNGVDVDLFRKIKTIKPELNIEQNKFVIGVDNSKSLENFKLVHTNYLQLIERFPNLFFIVFGNKDTLLKVDPEYFLVLPEVDITEMPRYYSLLDLFIIPRINNKMTQTVTPLKILEIMSCEVPPLVSNVGGLTTCINESVTGFVFDIDKGINSLINKLELILKSNKLKTIGKPAREWIIRNKTWKMAADRYLETYDLINKS